VSRQHARVVVSDEGATVEDLGSRNGVRVNGVPIRGIGKLTDGDRLRLGTQDLVISKVDGQPVQYAKTTGVLRLCANCHLPYAREALQCPNCESMEQVDDSTLSGEQGSQSRAWNIQLLIEALDRAMTLGRHTDVERLLAKVAAEVDADLVAGNPVEPAQLATVATQALRISVETNDTRWGAWVAEVYGRSRTIPPAPLVETLGSVAERSDGMRSALESLAASFLGQDAKLTPEERQSIIRLRQFGEEASELTPAEGLVAAPGRTAS